MRSILDDIVAYQILAEHEPEMILVENCLFLRDFGPWKFGQSAFQVRICFETSLVQELSNDGNVIRESKFHIMPGEKA